MEFNSLSLQQAIIGCCLLDEDAFLDVSEVLPEGVFDDDNLDLIYTHLLEMKKEESLIDIVTLSSHLELAISPMGESDLKLIGGRSYINDLALSVIDPSKVLYYIRLYLQTILNKQKVGA